MNRLAYLHGCTCFAVLPVKFQLTLLPEQQPYFQNSKDNLTDVLTTGIHMQPGE